MITGARMGTLSTPICCMAPQCICLGKTQYILGIRPVMKDAWWRTNGEDETVSNDDEKRMRFIGIGAVGIILGIFLTAIWGGFGIVDEFRSRDWTETDVIAVEQDRNADEWSYIFFFHYEVEGEQYNTTFECHINPANSGTTQNENGVQPWRTACLLGSSQEYLDMESIAYNPEDPSEIDVYPGFTWIAIFVIYGPKLGTLGFSFLGYIFLMRGLKGPTFGPWARVSKVFDSVLEQMKENKK